MSLKHSRYPNVGPWLKAYEILIRVAGVARDPDAALEALEAMMEGGYAPDVQTHGKMILVYTKSRRVREGFEVRPAQMRIRCPPRHWRAV